MTTPDTQQEQAELDQSIADTLYAAGAYCGSCDYESGPCPDCDACLTSYVKALEGILADVKRQAAAGALKEQARALGKTADFFRQQARAVEGKSMTSAEIYRAKADQCNLDANRLHREAQGIIAEGYEYTCEAGWDQCENRVPDAGDYCPRHEPEDDEDPRWAE